MLLPCNLESCLEGFKFKVSVSEWYSVTVVA